ncbi:MAG TPA: TolC family protein, partial [Candidatus Methylomirabilis sp.]|nr:TolC family protein [Candidatus Methylomirabilis sp.]
TAMAAAQAPTPQPKTPVSVIPTPRPLQAPPGLAGFPTPPQVVGREVTLEEALQIGQDNVPLVMAAIGDYAAARQRVNEALAPLLPQISGQWNGFENKNVIVSTGFAAPGVPTPRPLPVAARFVTTTATVTASQLLFDFGKTWAATDAAKSAAESFRQGVELQRLTVATNIKVAYFTLLLSKRLVAVNVGALERANLNLSSARAYFEVGIQPEAFVTRAEVDVANARVSLIQAQNAQALARVSLNTAMGIAIDSPTEAKDILAYEPYSVNSDAIVADALKRRPEYLQARAQADAGTATVRQRFRSFFPSIVASGTYGAGRPDMNEIYNYGVQLNWSLIDGGNMIAQYQEAAAALEALQARVKDTALTIWQDAQQSYLNMVAAEQQIGAAQKAVDSAQENYELSQGRFNNGVANIIELTDAQQSLTQAQSNEAQALAGYRIAIAQLQRAMGIR